MLYKGVQVRHRADNTSAIAIFGKGYSAKLAPFEKVIKVRMSFMRDVLKSGLVDCVHVCSEQNKANFFTKSLKKFEIEDACNMVRLMTFVGVPEKSVSVSPANPHQGGA